MKNRLSPMELGIRGTDRSRKRGLITICSRGLYLVRESMYCICIGETEWTKNKIMITQSVYKDQSQSRKKKISWNLCRQRSYSLQNNKKAKKNVQEGYDKLSAGAFTHFLLFLFADSFLYSYTLFLIILRSYTIFLYILMSMETKEDKIHVLCLSY